MTGTTKNIGPSGPAQTPGVDQQKQAKLRKAARDFEAIFVGYMLKTMRSTVPKSDLFDGGFGSNVLDGMFDVEMARHISQNRGLGLGNMMYRQLTGSHLPPQVPPAGGPGALAPFGRTGIHALSQKTSPATVDTVSQRVDEFNDAIRDAAERHAVDANVLKAVIAAESGGNAAAVSAKNAKGLMQLVDSTADDMGVKDAFDPQDNVLGGAKYLKQLLDQFGGNLELALAAYNAGPGAVTEHKGVPPFRETRDYVQRVMEYLQVFQNKEGGQ